MNKKKGFSIIEVLVSFFILVTGILVIYSSTNLPLRYSNEARNKIIAFYLAQEGVELVRNIRDNNFYNEEFWLNDIPTTNTGCFIIDYIGNKEEADCNEGKLYFNTVIGYSHDNTQEETKFRRVIKVLEREDDDLFSITSTVYWDDEEMIIYQDFHDYMKRHVEEEN